VGLVSLQAAANFRKICFSLAIQVKWRSVVKALHDGKISRSYRDNIDAVGFDSVLAGNGGRLHKPLLLSRSKSRYSILLNLTSEIAAGN
jgi:hypothetical protein